jgi:type IV pilus assembly protein PilB
LSFRGWTVIAETLEVTPEIAAALRRKATVEEIRVIAVGQGMTTMAADGIRRAAEGQVSLAEVLSTVGSVGY